MKNLSSLSAILLISGGLAACGGAETHSTDSNNSVQTQRTTDSSQSTAEILNGEQASVPAPAAAAEPSPEFAALPAPYQDASYSIGKRVFKLCSTCHTVAEGGPNLIGPNLYGVFGRETASVDGFSYSEALQNANFVWTPEKLDQWLESPRTFLPNNRMTFQGLRKPAEREAVIAYLMAESGWQTAE